MRNYKLYIFKSVKLDLPYGYRSKMARELGIPRETLSILKSKQKCKKTLAEAISIKGLGSLEKYKKYNNKTS